MSGTTTHSFGELDTLLQDTISISLDLLSDIIQQINKIESFVPEKEFFWNQQLSDLSSDITKFVEITTMMSRIMMSQKKAINPEIKQSHVHLLFVLKGINQARQKHDSVVLEDLIKYELKDNLTQWKIDYIPLIRRQLNY